MTKNITKFRQQRLDALRRGRAFSSPKGALSKKVPVPVDSAWNKQREKVIIVNDIAGIYTY